MLILLMHRLLLIVILISCSIEIRFFWNKNSTIKVIESTLKHCGIVYFQNEFYIYICRNDNFLTLNKLSLKYQNVHDIVNNFILEVNSNFLLLKEYFKKNALLYRYFCSTLFSKYFVE